MKFELLKEFCAENDVGIRDDESMAGHTSLKIGGPADIALFPDIFSLPASVRFLVSAGIPYAVIGGGTNVLVRDGGLEGAVIFTEGVNSVVRRGDGYIFAESGCSLQAVLGLCAKDGLSGLEGLAGIPGSVGGAVTGNAGSFGCEMKDVIVSAELLMSDGEVKTLPVGEMGFGYRKSNIPPGSVILGATLSFKKDEPLDVRSRIGKFRELKKKTQPLSRLSAGCVFKNPEDGPAGRFIDEAGCKGLRVGGVEVSEQHANFFLNVGKGTADDYLRLMELVTGKVREKFGIILEPEIRIIGKD